MVHKIIYRVIRPINRRGYASKIDAWVAYYIMTRQPVSLGYVWYYDFTQTMKETQILIRNHGYLTCLLSMLGFDLENVHNITLQGVRINESLISLLFDFIDGCWIYHDHGDGIRLR